MRKLENFIRKMESKQPPYIAVSIGVCGRSPGHGSPDDDGKASPLFPARMVVRYKVVDNKQRERRYWREICRDRPTKFNLHTLRQVAASDAFQLGRTLSDTKVELEPNEVSLYYAA